MDTLSGVGLGGRRFTDLFNLPMDGSPVGNDQFFVRTGVPISYQNRFPWKIRIGDTLRSPYFIDVSEIQSLERPQGVCVLECAGNDPGGRFGLLSAAEWDGASIQDILETIEKRSKIPNSTSRILISGVDDHAPDGVSVPGASWIFTPEQLVSSGAFLATRMNSEPLSPENGHPVRLIIPGWYGCACIKWIDRIFWVKENATATAHMQDYAERTHQTGIPALAKEFRPAVMAMAALPVRIEKWKVADGILYRVVGLLWGGDNADEDLQIRTGEEKWDDVEFAVKRRSTSGWSVWTYLWLPERPGDFTIRLRPKNSTIKSIRLESGYYSRTCRIDQV